MVYPHRTQRALPSKGVLKDYRIYYYGQALGTFSLQEATMAAAQSLPAEARWSLLLAHTKKSTIFPSACLSVPALPEDSMTSNQTLADEKQIQHHQLHHKEGSSKTVTLVPLRPRLTHRGALDKSKEHES